jgi:agmatinase
VTRIGNLFGPDFTFLGVPPADLDDPASFADADIVILGAPFDGGTSYRSGARFGPQAIRATDNNPHDGSRPSLALRTDALQDLTVVDAGDVEVYSGDIERSLGQIREAVATITAAGPIPVVLGGDHSITYSDTSGVADVLGQGRVSLIHFDAHADTGDIEFGSLLGSRPADAPADRVRRGARRPFPANRSARVLARAGDPGLDGPRRNAVLRDD